MRYIRTKDGVYVYADYLGIHNGKRYALMDDAKGNRITMCQEPEELYKTANTIEELCDRFVLITNRAHYSFGHFRNIERVVLGKEEKFIACYGAIWVDKGLIYVAKMNEDGVLCLI